MGELLSAKKLSNRILLVVILALTLLTFYFTVSDYNKFLDRSETEVVERLYGITQTASLQVEATDLDYLIRNYPSKDAIKSNKEDSVYKKVHHQLKQIAEANGLNSPLYTHIKSDKDSTFEFLVTSSQTPYYRHTYSEFPEQLLKMYEEGGKLDVHQSENGMWLSAFSPIKNQAGETIAVIQADRNFDQFYEEAKESLIENIGISLVIFLLVLAVVIRFLKGITDAEEKQKEELESNNRIIALRNKSISDSINYSKRLQDALIASKQDIEEAFPNSYLFFRGKDTVSGDFPYLYNKGADSIYIASVDCTGHGVPGALISIIGNFLLDDIIVNKGIEKPGDILRELHFGIVNVLNQEEEKSLSNDGMDIALLRVDKINQMVSFAGAHRPLLHLKESGELSEYKGSKLSIGGTQYMKHGKEIIFENHEVKFELGDSFHFFSDGYTDQFGGPKNFKFGMKNIRKFYRNSVGFSMHKIGEELKTQFEEWKGHEKQMDDVLIMGIKI